MGVLSGGVVVLAGGLARRGFAEEKAIHGKLETNPTHERKGKGKGGWRMNQHQIPGGGRAKRAAAVRI